MTINRNDTFLLIFPQIALFLSCIRFVKPKLHSLVSRKIQTEMIERLRNEYVICNMHRTKYGYDGKATRIKNILK